MNEPDSQRMPDATYLPSATVRTWVLTTAVVVLIPVAWVLAYTMPDRNNGLAAAATAMFYFLGGHALALMVAFGNVVHGIIFRDELGPRVRWVAWLSPLILLVSVAAIFVMAAVRG